MIAWKISNKISSEKDSRIKIDTIKEKNNLSYKIYKIVNGRLYTDRVHDTAIILENCIVEGPSYQLRNVDNAKVEENIVFKKGTPRIKKNLKGKVLSLLTGGAGNDNYWHWLFDVLPRIALYEKVSDIEKIDFFLLPSLEKQFQKDTLDLLKISKKNWFPVSIFDILAVPNYLLLIILMLLMMQAKIYKIYLTGFLNGLEINI